MESQKTKLHPEKHGTEKHDKPGSDQKEDHNGLHIRPSVHRLILQFLNEAVRAEDLMYGMPTRTHVHPTEVHPEHHVHHKPHEIIKSELVKKNN